MWGPLNLVDPTLFLVRGVKFNSNKDVEKACQKACHYHFLFQHDQKETWEMY